MATSTLIRRSELQPTAPAKTWPYVATIIDPDGAQLTEVAVLGPPRTGRLLFGDVSEQSALLDQYFGRGAQDVVLYLDDARIVGRLGTCWECSHRSWWLEVDEWLPSRGAPSG